MQTNTGIRVSEIFWSLQGEGVYTGVPMAFVRFAFCPWRCAWCDSVFTWGCSPNSLGGLPDLDEEKIDAALAGAASNQTLTVGEVVEQVREYDCEWVCITGGEPLAQPSGFRSLVKELSGLGYMLEVETSGLNPLPRDETFELIKSWVVDVKTPSSGMSRYAKTAELSRLRPSDQMKFVVRDRDDLDFAKEVCATLPLKHKGPSCTVLISPVVDTPFWEGQGDLAEIAEAVKREFPFGRLSLQMHKQVWGEGRGF